MERIGPLQKQTGGFGVELFQALPIFISLRHQIINPQ